MRSKTSALNSDEVGRMDEPRWYALGNRGCVGGSDTVHIMIASRSRLTAYNGIHGGPVAFPLPWAFLRAEVDASL